MCDDWGVRCPRWAGIRSDVVDVHGTRVHLLRADAREAPPDAPTQLLIHPMAAGATMWLDAIGPLTAYGPVVAPDLPGSVIGESAAPHHSAPRAEVNARFLRALTSVLGLDRVVVHGWSFGGLVSMLFADLAPERVERLVLVNPALPFPLSTGQRLGWQTLGRLAILLGAPLARGLLRLGGAKVLDLKQRSLADPNPRWDLGGGDRSRLSPELISLLGEQLADLRLRPQWIGPGITALASALAHMFIDQRRVRDAIRRLPMPTLLVWGDQDPLIERAVIDHVLECRPDWHLHVLETVGHLPPMEAPNAYAAAVGEWITASHHPTSTDVSGQHS
jgi:pimeloyl-ACP methyl ester carboxylesterase